MRISSRLLSRELIFLILQFLRDQNYNETLHMLEKESRVFFNMEYFEDVVMNGELEEVEKYLSGFTKLDDNRYSRKMFFRIRRHKYLEALDGGYKNRAMGILMKDLKVFSEYDEEIVKKLTMLLTLGNFRENEELSGYGDTKTARKVMLDGFKKLIQANPLFSDKLQFPSLNNSRLKKMIFQSLKWQHSQCQSPILVPEIKTLFVDHSCSPSEPSNGDHAPSPVSNPLMGSAPEVGGGFPPYGPHGLYPIPASQMALLSGSMADKSSIPLQTIATGPVAKTAPSNADSVSEMKRSRPFEISHPFNYPEDNNLSATNTAPSHVHTLSASSSNHGTSGGVADGREQMVPVMGQFNCPPVNLPVSYPAQSHVDSLFVFGSNLGKSIGVADGRVQMEPFNYPEDNNLPASNPAPSHVHTFSAFSSNPGTGGGVGDGREQMVPGIGPFNCPSVNLPVTYPAQSHVDSLFVFGSNLGTSGGVADGRVQVEPFKYPPDNNLSATNPAPSHVYRLSASSSNPGTNGGVADRRDQVAPVIGPVGDTHVFPYAKPEVTHKSKKAMIWKLTEIDEPSQLHSLQLPNSLLPLRVVRLIYTHAGCAILALFQNATHKVWKWQNNERQLVVKATTGMPPQLCLPSNGILMTNDVPKINEENAVSCLALPKTDEYLVSTSGKRVSIFIMKSFKLFKKLRPPPPAATFLAFHPIDNNIIAMGMDDCSIHIYNIESDEVKRKLHNHQKRVTGLAFSFVLNVLVSSGADAQLCVWSMDGWEMLSSKFLQIPDGCVPSAIAQTCLHFHPDQMHLLAVRETQIAIYKAPTLEFLKQWFPLESTGAIVEATYSCDGQSIYAAFKDGSVGVLTARTLQLKCRISPSAYIPYNPSQRICPVDIAAHPFERNQFALGLSDGRVFVIEPLESEGTWGTSPPVENVAET